MNGNAKFLIDLSDTIDTIKATNKASYMTVKVTKNARFTYDYVIFVHNRDGEGYSLSGFGYSHDERIEIDNILVFDNNYECYSLLSCPIIYTHPDKAVTVFMPKDCDIIPDLSRKGKILVSYPYNDTKNNFAIVTTFVNDVPQEQYLSIDCDNLSLTSIVDFMTYGMVVVSNYYYEHMQYIHFSSFGTLS